MHGTSTPGRLDKIPLPLHLTRMERGDEERPGDTVQRRVEAGGLLQIAMVNARDVAAVAVAALTADGHASKTYTITGPAALSFQEVAQRLSEATDRRVTYQDVPLATMQEELMATGMPAWLVDVRMEFTTALRDGFAAAVTDTVQTVTGQPARTFDAFAREHAALFRGA